MLRKMAKWSEGNSWSCFCLIRFLVLSKTLNCSHVGLLVFVRRSQCCFSGPDPEQDGKLLQLWFDIPPAHPGCPLPSSAGPGQFGHAALRLFVPTREHSFHGGSGVGLTAVPERCEDIFSCFSGLMTRVTRSCLQASRTSAGPSFSLSEVTFAARTFEELKLTIKKNYKRHETKLCANKPAAQPTGTNISIPATHCSKQK